MSLLDQKVNGVIPGSGPRQLLHVCACSLTLKYAFAVCVCGRKGHSRPVVYNLRKLSVLVHYGGLLGHSPPSFGPQ